MAIDPFDGNHVFLIDDSMLLESHNSCNTTQIFATPPNMNVNSIAFDPNNPGTLYAGTDNGAYISFDSGKSWNQINDGLLDSSVVYSIAVDKDGNVYASTPNSIYQLDSK
jgi:ligand-binding sensor domain-containing protein